jgi:hypothetical protein
LKLNIEFVTTKLHIFLLYSKLSTPLPPRRKNDGKRLENLGKTLETSGTPSEHSWLQTCWGFFSISLFDHSFTAIEKLGKVTIDGNKLIIQRD